MGFESSSPRERQEILQATLGAIHDPQERLTVAIGWKTGIEPLAERERIDWNLVRGCATRVWLAADFEECRCRFRIDAESPMVRGLVRLLTGIYDGATPADILNSPPAVLEDIGILRNLSPTRRNGLAAVYNAIRSFAAQRIV